MALSRINPPKDRALTFRISPELHETIEALAVADHRSVSAMVRLLLEVGLDAARKDEKGCRTRNGALGAGVQDD